MSAGCQTRPTDHTDAAAASLAGLRLEVPCADHFNKDTECHWDRALLQSQDPAWKLKREILRTFAGRPGVRHQTKLAWLG